MPTLRTHRTTSQAPLVDARTGTICVVTVCQSLFDYVEAAIGDHFLPVRVEQDEKTLTQLRSKLPDVVIVDGRESPLKAAALLGLIRSDVVLSSVCALIVTTHPRRMNEVWVRAGANGCVSTHSPPQKLLDRLFHLLGDRDAGPEGDDTGHDVSRELHDEVIQRLFAIGLQVRATQKNSPDADMQHRLQATAEDLESTIVRIRSTIFP